MPAEEAAEWIEAFLRALPGRLGRRLRGVYWGLRLKALGRRSQLDEGIVILGAGNIAIGSGFAMLRQGSLYAHEGGSIRIGDGVSLNFNVCLGAAEGGRIVIGDKVLIGQNSVLRASNHVFASAGVPVKEQGHEPGVISVEDDVWIGANVVIVPNVKIGAHAVVGAGAVVTKDVEPGSIVAGVPARPIGRRPGFKA